MIYLTNTFSPMMLAATIVSATVTRITLESAASFAAEEGVVDAISHETTAPVVAALIGREVAFNRTNISLQAGDTVIAVIPKFRTAETREFSYEEVSSAGFDCFLITTE